MTRKPPAAPLADIPDVTVDLALLHESGSQRYRCVGSMDCGSAQWLLLVRAQDLECRATAAKRVVRPDLVRVVEPKPRAPKENRQATLW